MQSSSDGEPEVGDQPLSLWDRTAPLVIMLLVVLGVYAINGRMTTSRATEEPEHPMKPTVHALLAEFDPTPPGEVFGFDYGDVYYIVTGTPGVHVALSYANAVGETVTFDDVALPWRLAFRPEHGRPLSITARNIRNHGTVKCTVIWEYRIVSQTTSQEPYGSVACEQ